MDCRGGGIVSASQHGGRIHAFARQHHLPLEQVLYASASINPLGPPASVLAALDPLAPWLRHYPDSDQWVVRRVLASRFGVDPDTIWCGNGATEVLDHMVMALKPARTWLVEPAFSEYARVAARHGSAVQRVVMPPPFDFPGALLDSGVSAHDLVVLNNPHSPSGRAWPRSDWEPFLRRWTARGAWVAVDEAFLDFLPDDQALSALPLTSAGRVLVIRSATKMFSLPGLRFGFGVGPRDLVERVSALRDPWSVNQLAQVAAVAAYRDDAFLRQTHRWLKDERPGFADALGRLPGVRVHSGRANFLLLEWASETAAQEAADQLAAAGILIRSLAAWRGLGARWSRVAVSTHPNNERLLDRLQTALT